MNLAQSLAAAAAALVMGLSAGGVAPAQTMSAIAAEAHARLQPDAIREAVQELADMLEERYVFPDAAERYAEHLRARAAAGAYDGASDPQQLAAQLQTELNGIHPDAHLRVTLSGGAAETRRVLRAPQGDEAFTEAQWLADGVAYLRIDLLPGDEASQRRMAATLDQHANANALILDLRTCRGGTFGVMDVLFSRLYGAPVQLMTMDTRAGAATQLEDAYRNTPTMRAVANAPRNINRWQHWAQPTTPASSLADARVLVLTGETASACEHLALALKETGRATLIGATTRGAGHYGSEQPFGGGQFEVFVPVGRSYVARTGQGWEGAGIAPDEAVTASAALDQALRDLHVAQTAAVRAINAARQTPPPARRVVEANPNGRRYGIMMAPPEPGASAIEVSEVAPGLVAESAGVRAGDRILSLNGRQVSDIAPGDFMAAMRASPMTIVVDRDGQRLTFEMSLGG